MKYKPGDIVLARVKLTSRTEEEDGKVTYKAKPLHATSSWSTEITEDDIRGVVTDKLEVGA